MNRKWLFIITSDPRQSGRTAEAIRIAAGVSAWKQVQVALYFHQTAALAVADAVDDLEDAELIERYLPMIIEHGGKIYVSPDPAARAERSVPSKQHVEITAKELALLAAQHDFVARF
ncbi:MAG: hypothetical protein AB1813_04800 [Verrucomicrobiota bacterium]